MYSPQEVQEALNTELLSDALYILERYATSQGMPDLALWARTEAFGYGDMPLDQLAPIAPYRIVRVVWVAASGLDVVFPPGLADITKAPLTLPVVKLESFIEKGGLWRWAAAIENLNRLGATEIDHARVEPETFKVVLKQIRQEALRRFHDAVGRTPLKKLIYSSPDFSLIVRDPDLVRILRNRWGEANQCFDCAAYTATIILLGSILEGALLDRIQANPAPANQAKAAPRDQATGKVRQFGAWTLTDLIEVSHECGWLKREARDFSKIVRDYRNFVHPNQERIEGVDISSSLCRITWEVVISALT
jgi:hypothetical protein